jgi:HlyD family secretion protein
MKPKPWMIVLIVAVVVVVLWLALRGDGPSRTRLMVSGTVEATEAQLGFPAPGLLQEVRAHEGDLVHAGDELAHLDRTETEARRAQAEAQVAAARALLEQLERGFRSEEVAQGEAARDGARQRLADAERDLDRTRQLQEAGAVSREALDKAQLACDLAQSQATQAEEQLRLLRAGTRREQVEAQRAQLAQAEAASRAIDAALANLSIRAPFDGVITVRHREPGEIVPAGSAVLTLMNRDDRWVRVFVPETRLGAVRLGQAATLTSDSDRHKTYRGEVVFIASEAEFTPKTVQTQEERVKLVYAVKVRITGDPDFALKPGLPVDVRLDLNGG